MEHREKVFDSREENRSGQELRHRSTVVLPKGKRDKKSPAAEAPLRTVKRKEAQMASLKAKQTYSGRRPVAGLLKGERCQTSGITRSRLAMHEMEKTIWASLRHWSSCQSFIRRRHNNSAPACSTRWASPQKSNLFVRQMSFE